MTFFKQYKNEILGFCIIIALLVSVAFLQKHHDTIKKPTRYGTPGNIKYVLPASVMKNLSFGFNNVLADFYWIQVIQDLTDWDRTPRTDFYIQEYRNIATLDPNFAYPYLFGILIAASKKYPESLLSMEPIVNIGIQNMPNNWEIPFYLGTGFQMTFTPDKALFYLKMASEVPNAPEKVREIYKSYLKKTISGEAANKEFIRLIYDTTTSKTTKKILKNNIVINDLTEVLQGLVSNYKKKYGYYPGSLDELVQKKMIRLGDDLKDGFIVTINRNTGEVEVVAKDTN